MKNDLLARWFARARPWLLGSAGLCWLGLAHAAQAQSPADPPPPLPRFYVGLQAVHFRFAGFGQTDPDAKPLQYNTLMPSLGYRFMRRWQLEVAAVWKNKASAGEMTVVEYPDGSVYRYYDSYQSYVVPVVMRFGMLPRARRWQAEALMGISLLHSRIEGHRSMTPVGQPTQPFEVGGFTEANDLPVVLGVGVTYSPVPHWTIRGDGRLNWSLLGSAAGAALFGGVFLPQAGGSVGVCYNFGPGL
jgi:hypothetical protein